MTEIKKGLFECLEMERVLSPVGSPLGQNTKQDLGW